MKFVVSILTKHLLQGLVTLQQADVFFQLEQIPKVIHNKREPIKAYKTL